MKWKVRETGDLSELEQWLIDKNIPPIFAPLFLGRGIGSRESLEEFFCDTIEKTTSPLLFGKELEKAVERLREAFEKKERIIIFGDYDVDGTTGTALIKGVLLRLRPHYGFDIDVMLSDRFTEGYGLNEKNIERLIAMEPDLIVTVDCGISSAVEIEKLKSLGIDTIITDHHELKGEFPKAAYAVVHPLYCNYPMQGLSGCGVAYQLMRGIWEVHGKTAPTWVVEEQLDLVALGAVCDIMPLNIADNRIYVRRGLQKIKEGKRLAFALMGQKLKWRKVDTYTLGFGIGPRINAAGRMKNADIVVNLLLSQDEKECLEILDELEERNVKRRAEQDYVVEEGLKQVQNSPYKNLTLVHGVFHEGVVGIAASKFIEHVYRPTFVLTEHGEQVKGSARSIPGINLFKLIEQEQLYLTYWGGHEMAAGLTLPKENIAPFFAALEEALSSYPQEVWEKTGYIDGVLKGEDLTEDFFKTLLSLEPFGEKFPPITWKVMGILTGRELDENRKIGKIKIEDKEFPFAMWKDANKAKFGNLQSFYGRWEWSDYHNAMQFRIIDVE